jgi:membrane fusion protein (multidrug efflux system)
MKLIRWQLIPLMMILAACSSEQEFSESKIEIQATDGNPAIEIEVFTIKTELFAETIEATGTIAAKQTSRIGPLVEGVLETVHVRVGDRLRKGDPLFQMRSAEYQQAVDQATAAMEVARADLDLSIKKLKRARQLRQDNLLSQDNLDLTETSARVAQARFNSTRAALASANQQLKDTLVVAPFNGTVTGRFADEGVYMSNRFSMGGQSSVIELSEAEIVAGIMRVPEAQLPKLKIGQRATLYAGELNASYESEVYIINDRVDPTTRTAEFRLPVLNPDYQIKPGQFTYAEVFIEPREMIKVPRTSVVVDGYSQFVFRKDNAGWVRVPVKTVAFNSEYFELQEGLSAGEQIALVGHLVTEISHEVARHHVDR